MLQMLSPVVPERTWKPSLELLIRLLYEKETLTYIILVHLDIILTAEVVDTVFVCIGAGITGCRASGIGRLIGKVATVDCIEEWYSMFCRHVLNTLTQAHSSTQGKVHSH